MVNGSDIHKIFFYQTKKYFREIGIPADVKYIDPTYMIRACRANASDGILCTVLGQNAVSLSLSSSCWWSFSIPQWCNTLYYDET